MNPEKLKALQLKSTQIGGKGTPRRKTKPVHRSAAFDDKKLTAALKKSGLQPIGGFETIDMVLPAANKVLHFQGPRGMHAPHPTTAWLTVCSAICPGCQHIHHPRHPRREVAR